MSEPQNASLEIPQPNMPLKLAPSIRKLTSGSATGNPRNKCALKPGHSLMDWIRLGNSGCDLSGTKGAIIPINHSELSKHCTQDDAWMAIRGKVYNVTRYMDFHPGGPEELMRGVGKDATKLFDEVHAWVNYEQLLKHCLIGPLRNVVKIDADFLQPTITSNRPAKKTPMNNLKPPPKPAPPTEVIPRFDWIQKKSDLTLCFYTKQFCNPGIIVKRKNPKSIVIRIFIENQCHSYDFELHDEVQWPPTSLKVSSESGKCEVSLAKSQIDVWPGYGSNDITKLQQLEDFRFDFRIVEKQKINHNAFALQLSGSDDVVFCLPVGFHVTFTCTVDGQEVSRSYTPVPKHYASIKSGNSQDLYFLLKAYEDGLLAKHISCLNTGSAIELSQQKGSLQLNKFLSHTRIGLLAAGSGITPMLGLIDHLLGRNSNRIEKLTLMFFNKTEDDIWCREMLDDVAKKNARFHITHILSQPNDEWTGEKGHISTTLVSTFTDLSSTNHSTFICACGPPVFNNLAETMLKAAGFSETVMHFFKG